ncbi:MAG: HIT family protein [Acidimicrobiales bacterium]
MSSSALALEDCPFCALAGTRLARPAPAGHDAVAAYADDKIVVLLQRDTTSVLVAPSTHVDRLAELTERPLAGFLAALRRVAVDVQAVFGCSGTTIEPRKDVLPSAHGHISFEVIPSPQSYANARASGDLMVRAEQLADLIRD